MVLPYDEDPDPNFKGRYYHPWEAAAAMGWPAYIALPGDIDLARHITGNGLTTLQAVLRNLPVPQDHGSKFAFWRVGTIEDHL